MTIISAVRLYYIVRLYYYPPGPDMHYALGYITSSVEINLAIITASAPALWPLARRWFPGLFERIGIDRERRGHLYPDIEVGYATPHSAESGGRMLQGKITWHTKKRVPSGVMDGETGAQGSEGGGQGDSRTSGRMRVEPDDEDDGEIFGMADRREKAVAGPWSEDQGHGPIPPRQGPLAGDEGQWDQDRGLRTSFRGL